MSRTAEVEEPSKAPKHEERLDEGDEGEQEKQKEDKGGAGWFRNPFRKDDGGKAEKEKEIKKQQKEKEAENKKLKEEQETKKEEQEETARQAQKRQRYQELLQKNLDPTRRVFQMRMKAIKVENLSETTLSSAFLKVTLGGDYTEREEPGKGLVRKGTKGQVLALQTHPTNSLMNLGSVGS